MAKIAVDAMGGDHGPKVTVPAAIASLSSSPSLELVLIGHEDDILKHLPQDTHIPFDRLQILHTTEQVLMSDKPASIVRAKSRSSLRLSIEHVKNHLADACVSAGNTGALMILGKLLLKTLPGIDRPALAVSFPTQQGTSVVLDLGANVDCTAQHLLQFALMGDVLARVTQSNGQSAPRTALLNVGSESIKGNTVVLQAAELIDKHGRVNYTGFIEGDDIFKGVADVIVCDGFVGNIVLKATEGLFDVFSQALDLQAPPRNLSFLSTPAFYRGASMLGLQGVLIKSHGKSSIKSFSQAIFQAEEEVEGQLVNRLSERLV